MNLKSQLGLGRNQGWRFRADINGDPMILVVFIYRNERDCYFKHPPPTLYYFKVWGPELCTTLHKLPIIYVLFLTKRRLCYSIMSRATLIL